MKNKKLHIWIALVVIAFFVCLAIFGCGDSIKGIRDMRFGIDIRGGVEAVFEPAGLKTKPTKEQLEMARDVIETRLDAQNILDREVTVDEKAGDIIVRFPWKSDEKDFDPETAIQELGEMAELTFRGEDNTVYVKGSDVSKSQVAVDQQNRYVVELEFTSKGAKKFADATEKLVGQTMRIYMDEELISNPTVNAKITGGKAEITGMASQEEAQNLSDKINSGALPFSMETTNYNTISPTLGNKALNAMALAAEIALVLTCLFMIAWYRLPGVISCLTLAFQVALQVLVISVPQYTITLPGIAGLILSAGMAVDANIIISERISEELKKGNSVRTAVKNGYKRAFSSVLDGNVTTAADCQRPVRRFPQHGGLRRLPSSARLQRRLRVRGGAGALPPQRQGRHGGQGRAGGGHHRGPRRGGDLLPQLLEQPPRGRRRPAGDAQFGGPAL